MGLPYRYGTIQPGAGAAINASPYSPMALNNLNNPYSPQPAAPVSTTCPEDMFVTTFVGGGNGVPQGQGDGSILVGPNGQQINNQVHT